MIGMLIGATIIYGLVCITTARTAKDMGDSRERWTGLLGLILMIAFGTYLLLPGLIAHGSLAKETCFLFIIWSILGSLFFRSILRRDNGKNFGASLVVWVAVLALVLLISLIRMRQSMIATSELVQENILNYYAQQGILPPDRTGDAEFIVPQISAERSQDTRTMVIAVGMFLFALFVMLSNHSFMDRRFRESEMLANVDPMTGVKSKHAFLMCEKDHNGQIAKGEVGEFAVIVTERDYNIRKELMIALHDRSVTHIIEIADYLDVPVVAEGVETEEQYLTLKEMGCDLVQGYFFSRPVPPEEFEKFLLERIEAQEEQGDGRPRPAG